MLLRIFDFMIIVWIKKKQTITSAFSWQGQPILRTERKYYLILFVRTVHNMTLSTGMSMKSIGLSCRNMTI